MPSRRIVCEAKSGILYVFKKWRFFYTRCDRCLSPVTLMLTGTLTYLAGWAVWLWTWQACVVWVAFFVIMFVQILSEEKRLRRDFGEEYTEFCRRRRRF